MVRFSTYGIATSTAARERPSAVPTTGSPWSSEQPPPEGYRRKTRVAAPKRQPSRRVGKVRHAFYRSVVSFWTTTTSAAPSPKRGTPSPDDEDEHQSPPQEDRPSIPRTRNRRNIFFSVRAGATQAGTTATTTTTTSPSAPPPRSSTINNINAIQRTTRTSTTRTESPQRCMYRAHQAEKREEYDAAITWSQQALAQLPAQSWKAAECLDALTKEHWRLGRLEQALEFAQQALQLKQELLAQEEEEEEAGAEGTGEQAEGRKQPAAAGEKTTNRNPSPTKQEGGGAMPSETSSLSVLQKHKSRLAASWSNLGCLHLEQGAYQQALEDLTQAATLRQAVVPDSLDLAITYTNLGHVFAKLNRHGESFAKYMQARRIKEKLAPHSASLARTYLSLASVPGNLVDTKQKWGFLEKAQMIANKLSPQPLSLLAQINLHKGHALVRARKNPEHAKKYLEVALRQEETISNSSLTLASMLLEVANVYEKEGLIAMLPVGELQGMAQTMAKRHRRRAEEIRRKKAPALLQKSSRAGKVTNKQAQRH